ncbi:MULTISPECIES: hypothetical protein [Bacillus]
MKLALTLASDAAVVLFDEPSGLRW